MNRELLKRIAKEAGMIGDKSGMFYAIDDHNVGGVDLEKFAESIGEECINVVIGCDTNPKMVLHEPYRNIVSNIQDYFYGIE
jgi:hypothetical protein